MSKFYLKKVRKELITCHVYNEYIILMLYFYTRCPFSWSRSGPGEKDIRSRSWVQVKQFSILLLTMWIYLSRFTINKTIQACNLSGSEVKNSGNKRAVNKDKAFFSNKIKVTGASLQTLRIFKRTLFLCFFPFFILRFILALCWGPVSVCNWWDWGGGVNYI